MSDCKSDLENEPPLPPPRVSMHSLAPSMSSDFAIAFVQMQQQCFNLWTTHQRYSNSVKRLATAVGTLETRMTQQLDRNARFTNMLLVLFCFLCLGIFACAMVRVFNIDVHGIMPFIRGLWLHNGTQAEDL